MKNKTQQILQTLRTAGERITPFRQTLVEILIKAKSPLSALEIQKKVTANKTTIYRELQFLVKNKIAEEVWLGTTPLRYEITESHHHHLVCVKCQKVSDIEFSTHLEDQERQILKRKKFKVLNHALEFFGLCNNCQ